MTLTDDPDGVERRVREGDCADCRHVRRITSAKGSQFVRCEQARHDGRLLDYPPLPVLGCPAHQPVNVPR